MSTMSSFRRALAGMLGYSHDGLRDLYASFGYPRALNVQHFAWMYQRNGVANRIIKAFPQSTWQRAPKFCDEASNTTPTDPVGGDMTYTDDGRPDANEPPFMTEIRRMMRHQSARNVRRVARKIKRKNAVDLAPTGAKKTFGDACADFIEKRNMMQYLERADRLASIGRYGVLLMGFRDGRKLTDPVEGNAELLYVSPFDESCIVVSNWDQDPQSERFGLPNMYSITQKSVMNNTGQVAPGRLLTVHHSRVIHIAENLESDEVFGIPRLQPVFNNLMDLEKVVGGSAETFWLTANRGVAFWADKEAQLDDDQVQAVKVQAEELVQHQRRTIVGQGMTAQVLGSDDPDPGPNVDKLQDLIAGGVGIPKRVLFGSERGELASSQDSESYAARITERQNNFAGPFILRPFIQKMIDTGNLPQPQGEWWVEWEDTTALGKQEEATIGLTKTQTLAAYSNTPGADLIVPPTEFRTKFLGLEPESEYQDEILEAEQQQAADEEQRQAEAADRADALSKGMGGGDQGPPKDDKAPVGNTEVIIDNSKPRSVYISRKVLNASKIINWAKAAGFKDIEADNLHVTIMRSTKPVDWMKLPSPYPSYNPDDVTSGGLMVPAGGARVVEAMGGDGKAIALLFQHGDLHWRHMTLRDCGCEWDYQEYQPHITITYKGTDLNLDDIEPYRGAIALGPEIWEEVEEQPELPFDKIEKPEPDVVFEPVDNKSKKSKSAKRKRK